MLMGEGKTTVISPLLAPHLPCISPISPLYLRYISAVSPQVISPLLALLLGESNLVIQIVPAQVTVTVTR